MTRKINFKNSKSNYIKDFPPRKGTILNLLMKIKDGAFKKLGQILISPDLELLKFIHMFITCYFLFCCFKINSILKQLIIIISLINSTNIMLIFLLLRELANILYYLNLQCCLHKNRFYTLFLLPIIIF